MELRLDPDSLLYKDKISSAMWVPYFIEVGLSDGRECGSGTDPDPNKKFKNEV
jgi:hypothetical protein